MQNYCLKYAKQVEITKTNQNNNFCYSPCSIEYFIVVFLSILQSDAIFVLSGTKNDIAGQKTISRDKKRYRGTYRFYVSVLSP